MARELRLLQVSVQRERGEPPTIVVGVISEDLKSRPVHLLPVTEDQAIGYARQLLAAVEAVRRG